MIIKTQSPSSGAAFRNGVYRGKDLTNIYTIDEICSRISNGSFDDLYIGDYFDITISSEYATNETVHCILAGFDIYYNTGDGKQFLKHRAVIVPEHCFVTRHAMNSTDSALGGYKGSNMWNTVLPIYNNAFEQVFGTHLLTYRTQLSSDRSTTIPSQAGSGLTGGTTLNSWTDVKLSLLSEIQIYGTLLCSSSFLGFGINNTQLPLFRLVPYKRLTVNAETPDQQIWYWLSGVAGSNSFCICGGNGEANHQPGGKSTGGLRPCFCIG